jgi:hypothetical protein
VDPVTEFDQEYKKSNRLLPVYRVSFTRPDGIRLYVDTESGKLAAAIDNRKASFNRFFAFAHSWSFLDGMGTAKQWILGIFSILCMFSALAGFFVYNLVKSKNKGKNLRNRKAHRIIGNVFVLTTVLFAFSGAWHSLHKTGKKDILAEPPGSVITVSEMPVYDVLACSNLFRAEELSNFSIARVSGKVCLVLSLKKKNRKYKRYVDTETGKEFFRGEQMHALGLARHYSGLPNAALRSIKSVHSFSNRYSMMNKKLPVWEVQLQGARKTYYIETSTGLLSSLAGNADAAERFSFSQLHMHHYWEDLFGKEYGKPLKNGVLIGSTLGLFLLSLTGLLLYACRKLRTSRTGKP